MSKQTTTSTVTPTLLPKGYWQIVALLLGYGHTLKRIAVFTQLDVVLIGIVGSLLVTYVLGLQLTLAPGVVALVVFAVYVGDRISDIKREPESTSERNAFMKHHRTVLSVASAMSYGLAVAIAAYGGPVALVLTLVPGIAWVLYASEVTEDAVPVIIRLKKFVVLNSAIVAAGWATALVAIPVAFADQGVGPVGMVLFVYFFIDIFIGTEIANFRDMADDARNGVTTLPLALGVRRSRQLLHVINVFLVAILLVAFVHELLSLAFLGAALLGRLYTAGLQGFIGRTERHRLLEFLYEMDHVVVATLFITVLFA
ncbi:UbiA family prenyltransferase [Halanaeroarchaeum sulfurireducens]|uniref:4-hydroxybenzoate polyprenyltransferase n=1 Tax=Halanaeroarchaeum sulfurireducens TaxID=1604004 RepID=A0A0F7PDA7_9EURY|nr:UbiA family prenyltransferase [Halanaeroarchaeum sulfurireducens]AKH97338.1 4-hydroxybenzoate polyprenyltransferase [Halanaeroarchaeum sulfurireducens]ALG81740.1 4-hydroxybenzoate polyprenyltransferase [Halanaeroarchaeum sulfurireducens]